MISRQETSAPTLLGAALIKQPAVGEIKASGETRPHIILHLHPNCAKQMFAHLLQVQPVDTVLLAGLKSRSDAYESVVSASPLLHLTHPTSQPLRRPLTITLPCPPNSEKKEEERRKESKAHQDGAPSDPLIPSGKVRWVKSVGTLNRLCRFLVLLLSYFPFCVSIRILGGYVRSNETSNELLIVLGSRDKQWTVLDQIVIRNQKNGLVSFDLMENFERLVKRYPRDFHLFNLPI